MADVPPSDESRDRDTDTGHAREDNPFPPIQPPFDMVVEALLAARGTIDTAIRLVYMVARQSTPISPQQAQPASRGTMGHTMTDEEEREELAKLGVEVDVGAEDD